MERQTRMLSAHVPAGEGSNPSPRQSNPINHDDRFFTGEEGHAQKARSWVRPPQILLLTSGTDKEIENRSKNRKQFN